jgi:hypothetical protein
MKKFHKIVTKAKELATKRGLQGEARRQAMYNYVVEELDRELTKT